MNNKMRLIIKSYLKFLVLKWAFPQVKLNFLAVGKTQTTKTSLVYKKHHFHSYAWHMEDIPQMFTELNVQLSFFRAKEPPEQQE